MYRPETRGVVTSSLDPSLISTERYPSAAALFDPDCATHTLFTNSINAPRDAPLWARMCVFEAYGYRAYAASAMALRDPGGLLALASPSRTA